MNKLVAFAIELAVTLGTIGVLVAYLQQPLRRILIDLCGTEDRAQFWTSFTSLLLIVMPAVSALAFHPVATSLEETFFELMDHLGRSLLGFVIALIGVGLVVAFFALVAPRTRSEKTA